MASIRRILCPIDFSAASQHAIEHALAMARWYGARVTALHVYDPVFMAVPGLPAPEQRVPQAEIHRVSTETAACVVRAGAEGVPVDVVVGVGHPAHEILHRSVALGADLIVMGTHGTSGFAHLVLGSVTEKVLRKAPCAVLTVPPHAQASSTLPFKRILCAVDLSEASGPAVERACSLAQESGAALTVLHVVEWPWPEPPAPDVHELPPDQARALAAFRRGVEKDAVDRLAALLPEALRNRLAPELRVAHGKAYVEILRIAAGPHGVDLIVMGVGGRNSADLALFGSTTSHVVRSATCPVLTVRH